MIISARYIHVHILFGSLYVSLDLRCNVKTQFLRHGQGNHGGANHFSSLPDEKT